MERWLFLVHVSGLAAVQAVDVQTKYGPVRGQTHRLHTDIEVNSFLGIPFAKPPVGNLRFEKPQEPDSWTDVYLANTLGDVCTQSPTGLIWITHPLWGNISEDCLNLNIYTPTDQSRGPYAVMVYLYGGGYQSGGNIQYPGYYLASRDVILVVPNYRLGKFGYLTTGDSVVPGNMGMWDQIQALRFVQENIAQFGGDPSKVTIFGESAGAASVGLLIVSPPAQDLFSQAILQSGTELAIWAINLPDSQPENYTKSVAEKLNCPIDDNQQMIDCLKTVDPEDLRTTRFDCAPGHICLGMEPVVDGAGGFLPDLPIKMRQTGQYKRCNMITGFNKEDASLFLLALGAIMDLTQGINRTAYEIIMQGVVAYFDERFPERSEDVYQAIMFNYSPWPYIQDPIKNRDELIMFATDIAFGASADYQLKMHVDESTAYMYVYGYHTKTVNTTLVPEWLGTPHALEVPYVFGFPMNQFNPGVVDESLSFDYIDYDQEDVDYSAFTMDLWTNFAKFGNPTPTPIQPPNNNPAMTWQEYKHGSYNTLMIDRQMENRLNYRQKYFAFFNSYLAWMLGVDSITSFAQGWAGSFLDTLTDQVVKLYQNYAPFTS